MCIRDRLAGSCSCLYVVDYGVLNDFLKEWGVRMDELKSGVITRDEYFEWKINWPYTLSLIHI